MTAGSAGFADPTICLPDVEALRRMRDVVPSPRESGAEGAGSAPPLESEQVSHGLDLTGRVLVAASIASLAIPKSHEGKTLLDLSRQHGLTTSSLASLIGLTIGLFILARIHCGYRNLWADLVASRGGPLVFLGVGLGASATLLSDGLEWMWIPAGALVLVGLSLGEPDVDDGART
jgi:hypothetical protein